MIIFYDRISPISMKQNVVYVLLLSFEILYSLNGSKIRSKMRIQSHNTDCDVIRRNVLSKQ